MPPKFLFLGVGNRDRGDDGVGPLLAEKLLKNKVLKELGVDILPHSGEGASLMDLWEGTEKTVIVDSMKSGLSVGNIRRFDARVDRLSGGTFYYSSHLFSLAEAVEMARQLDRLPSSLIVYGIEGGAYSFGAGLSSKVAKALPGLAKTICREFTDA